MLSFNKTKEAGMKGEKVSTQRKVCIANEVLEAVETHCVLQREDIQYVVEEFVHYSYNYASQCFKNVTNINLGKYVRRRILTEVYRKHLQEYSGFTREERVDGIKNFKRRMKTEFGDPVEKLQDRIKLDDDIEDLIFDGELCRYCKKEVNKLEEECATIWIEDNRIALIENGKVSVREWENKMIKHNELCYTLSGLLHINSNIVDKWLSSLIQQTGYISQIIEYPVEKILEYIADYHDGNSSVIPGLLSFSINILGKEGRWEYRDLISHFAISLENNMPEIQLSPRWLKWEENNLYLYLE